MGVLSKANLLCLSFPVWNTSPSHALVPLHHWDTMMAWEHHDGMGTLTARW